jgi:hypothetical protein
MNQQTLETWQSIAVFLYLKRSLDPDSRFLLIGRHFETDWIISTVKHLSKNGEAVQGLIDSTPGMLLRQRGRRFDEILVFSDPYLDSSITKIYIKEFAAASFAKITWLE